MKKLVLKIGSSSLFCGKSFAEKRITELALEIKKLRDNGVEVYLITSGAIAMGMNEMGLSRKPSKISSKQALAAIGQTYLMEKYEKIFDSLSIKPAQILLNHDDFGNRTRENNLRNTLEELISFGALPIINENDTLATEEIKVGDNDTLAAMVATTVGADMLVIISDVDGLFDKNPSVHRDAKLIKVVEKIDKNIESLAKAPTSKVGTGGMITKLKAGKICTSSNISMMIVGNDKIPYLSSVEKGENLGTLFTAVNDMNLRKTWILYLANVYGKIVVDDGAKEALKNRKSLLACGIVSHSKTFSANNVVEIYDKNDNLIAKGVAEVNGDDIDLLKSNKRSKVVAHADRIALIKE